MNDVERILAVCRTMESRSDEPLKLEELAKMAGMSKFHFARRFKSIVGVTPKKFIAGVRVNSLKRNLKAGTAVDGAIYDAGYGSPSRVYENAAKNLGMTPAQYRRAGEGVEISYATLETPAGLLMIGATDRGICFAQFGDSQPELLERLRAEYRNAAIAPMRVPRHPDFERWVVAVQRYIEGESSPQHIPLDVRATSFQMRVWKYLQSIPYGEVQSYNEVAAGIEQPQARRAVAQACAHNPVAVIVPCHRVIRANGDIGGYRWGVERKRALIAHERGQASQKG